jgi:hypothetical protein
VICTCGILNWSANRGLRVYLCLAVICWLGAIPRLTKNVFKGVLSDALQCLKEIVHKFALKISGFVEWHVLFTAPMAVPLNAPTQWLRFHMLRFTT